MFGSSRRKSFVFVVLAASAALFSAALVVTLIELLGDATVVDPNVYRNREKWNPNAPVTVGMEAARALTSAEGDAVEPLIAALSRKETEARKNVAWALGVVGDKDKER